MLTIQQCWDLDPVQEKKIVFGSRYGKMIQDIKSTTTNKCNDFERKKAILTLFMNHHPREIRRQVLLSSFRVFAHPTRRHFDEAMRKDAKVLKKTRSQKSDVSRTRIFAHFRVQSPSKKRKKCPNNNHSLPHPPPQSPTSPPPLPPHSHIPLYQPPHHSPHAYVSH